MPDAPDMIRAEAVSIVFGDRPDRALALMDEGLDRAEIQRRTGQVLGVHDCSLTLRRGEISVLMGLSGSGKSTLLRAVNGLNPITRGRMLVRGRDGAMVDVAACDRAALRQLRRGSVAMVFQQFALLPWRSVADNVALGLELSGMPRRARRDRVRAVLEVVGLAEWATRPVSDLSGGMQQRVGLARAFATEAEILLMDEPFSALDPLIRSRLQDELLALQSELGMTILFVSHDLEEAVKLGSTISIMEGGRIVQSGAPEAIVLNPATPHVAEFVAHLNPLAVLRVGDVAVPGTGSGPVIDATRPLREALGHLAAGERPVVAGAPDAPPRQLTPEAVLAALMARPAGGGQMR